MVVLITRSCDNLKSDDYVLTSLAFFMTLVAILFLESVFPDLPYSGYTIIITLFAFSVGICSLLTSIMKGTARKT